MPQVNNFTYETRRIVDSEISSAPWFIADESLHVVTWGPIDVTIPYMRPERSLNFPKISKWDITELDEFIKVTELRITMHTRSS